MEPEHPVVEPHKAARPIRFVKDGNGEGWLCDKDVDTNADLAAQGCWRCGDLAFTASE